MGHELESCLFLVFLLKLFISSTYAFDKGGAMVQCSPDSMLLAVPVAGVQDVRLPKWSVMPRCHFTKGVHFYTLVLPLGEDLPCGTTRVFNTATGSSLFYQRVALQHSARPEEEVLLKCSPSHNASLHNLVRRDLPPEFVEPDYIEITSEVSGSAPVPVLGVGVRQEGALVDGAVNVAPGTPLTMEVYLDDGSAGTYGILVSYLEVTDNANKKETIVYNGCTIDPNLFENFGTKNGDYLSAKFRAFKFPESNYVLFRGTVDVCLDKCQGITCSDGLVGYGRRRRATDSRRADPNKLFEVTMTTIIKFADNSTDTGLQEAAEVLAEELMRDELLRLRLEAPHSWEEPLTRRSFDHPPSVAFNTAVPCSHPVLLLLGPLLLYMLL